MAAGWNKGIKHSDDAKQKIRQSMIQYWLEHPDESLRKQRTEAATRSKQQQQLQQRQQQ